MNWKPFTFKSRPTRRRHFRHSTLLRLEEFEARLVPSTNVTAYHQASPTPSPASTIGAGVNSNETILTPGDVNSTDFGKLFATTVDGQVYAQPLYMENVSITTGANQGTHNVVFIATQHDSLYAVDANTGTILWHDALLTAEHGGTVSSVPSSAVNSGDISPEVGITATPVIDPATGSIFVENKTQEVASGGTHVEHHLYAISIGSGVIVKDVLIADSIGDTYVSGPSVEGTGDGSSGGAVKFDSLRQLDRPALTFVNGNIYLAYASHGDNPPYHGWILGYSESTLALTAVFNANPNGNDDGIWQSGGTLDYETVNGSTYLYFETGNGTFDTTLTSSPFNSSLMIPNKGDYGDAFVKVEIDGSTPASGSLDAANNINGWGMHVADYFTPMNEANLSGGDTDLGSGAPLLLPASAGSAAHPNLLVGSGKEGRIYLIDRDNMGGYHGDAAGDGNSGTDNVVQETTTGAINGSLDTPTFLNGVLYYVGGYGDEARTFTVANGVMSSASVTQSGDNYPFPGSTATISTNPSGGNAIVWDTAGPGTSQLRAYNASQGYSSELYTSAQAASSRDSFGSAVKFTVPTVADGEVFVGTTNSVVAYGLLQQATAPPAAPSNLAATAFSGSVISLAWNDNDTAPDSAAGYNIFQSGDGTNFTQVGTASARATAFAVGGLQDSTKYYFEINAFDTKGTSAFSNVANATTTSQAGVLDFSSGFAGASGVLTYNGSAKINGTNAELTDGGGGEAGSVFSTNAVDVSTFSNQFTFQLTNANADGYTFTIQGNGPTALGPSGGGLGYGGTSGIPKSVAIKFDLYSNAGEGSDSTGEYTDGASPTVPAIDLSTTGINLHSGDVFRVVMSYDGTTLHVTITDTNTNASASQAYTVNIPQVIGNNTGYVGFTGGTGGTTAVQNILTWDYSPTATSAPSAPSSLTGTVVSGSQIDISWTNNATDATGVLIDRSTDGIHFAQITSVSATVSTYHDTSLSPGNTYYYEVQATNAAGNSPFSNVFQAATLTSPAPPTHLAAANITTTEVDLTWTNVATDASGIKILKQLGNNSSQVIASGLSPTTTSYHITGLIAGSPYLFEVDALNSNGPSGAATISADTLPAEVTGVTATPGPSQITIRWADDPGAATYNVYRATTAGAEGTTPVWSGIPGTSYVGGAAIPGITYYYTVSAVDPKSASPTDPTGEGTKSAEVSAVTISALQANQDFIGQLYHDLLGRPASSADLAYWTNLLDQGSLTRTQVVAQITGSAEYDSDVVQGLYQKVVRRGADPGGLSFFTSFLAQGGTEEQAEAQLLGSGEFYSKSGGTNAGFLNALYQVVLNRPIDASSLQTWEQALANGTSRTALATAVLGSKEAETDELQNFYQQLLHRPADPAGLAAFLQELQQGTPGVQVIAALAGSAEYAQDAGADANQIYISHLYQDLLDRPADAGGLNLLTSALDDGTLTRQAAAQAILTSNEYRVDEVQRLYQTYLKRPADAGGLTMFVTLLNQGSTDEQVAAALAGSQEFFQTQSGSTNAGFLNALYEDALGRTIDPTGLASWEQALASGTTRGQVATALFASTEYRQDLVRSFYQSFLRRRADPTGLATFTNELSGGARDEHVIAPLVESLEYYGEA